jgi:YD repeat-containing protein
LLSSHHDALGRLLHRVGVGGSETVFSYDGAGRRVAEEPPSGPRSFVWDAAGRLAGDQRRWGDDAHGGQRPRPVPVGGVTVERDTSSDPPRAGGIKEVGYERQGDSLVGVALVGVGADAARTVAAP